MKYTVNVEIDLPRARVIELFDSEENLYKWQEGLQSIELIRGTRGAVGAESKLVFKMGKRDLEMTEKIIRKELPDLFESTYDAKGVYNVVQSRFIEVGPEKTRYESENEFQFSGFMKVIGFLMKGAFPKQTMKYLTSFKAFAEHGTDVREAAK